MARRTRTRQKKSRQPSSEITGLLIVAVSILAGASLFMEGQTGLIGEFLNRIQFTLAGRDYALFLPFSLLLWGLRTMLFPHSENFGRRALGLIIAVFCLLGILHLNAAAPNFDRASLLNLASGDGGGGILGALTAIGMIYAFGRVGSVVFMLFLTFLGLMLVANLSLKDSVVFLSKWLRKGAVTLISGISSLVAGLKDYFMNKPLRPKPAGEEAAVKAPQVTIHDYQEQHHEAAPEPVVPVPEPEPTLPESVMPLLGGDKPVPVTPVVTSVISVDQEESQQLEDSYQLPAYTLLQKTIRLKDPQSRRELVSQADLLEQTLANFGIDAKVINVHRGPTITRFEIQPAAGVKVSRIVSLADDLALSLAATSVRIEAPIPGKSAIGLEVANKAKATVYFREVLETPEFMNNNSRLAIALGKDIAGEPIIADMVQIPHLLIAGATGSGKSVCLNAIIASFLFKAKPSELKLMLIDPKVVELNIYNGLPHLLCPVITDPRQASQGLKNIVKEMEQRYQLFAATGARDINRYNDLVRNKGENTLPYIVVIIDELADLMLTAPTEVEDTICRVAQKSRAAGIHLIVATQRPSVDVITGVIKANITTRIAFSVSSQADSRTILDMGGAEKLLGRGDMLYLPVGANKPVRVQSAYISDEEVEKVVAHVLGQSVVVIKDDFLQPRPGDEQEEAGEEQDELLAEAARLIVESGQASISILQRRLRIGYTRAARLIDDMEKVGIVGGFEGSKARKILVSLGRLEELLKSLGLAQEDNI